MIQESCKMQPRPKPKSAPASRLSLQSRLAKNQSDAMKEMQAWAKRAEEPGACCPVTRMSGHLTDNVTEERLLRAKLWELSKERYKFLLQNTYEKKLFADRMQRKTQAMLKARANSAAVIRSSTQAKPRPLTTSAVIRPRPVLSASIPLTTTSRCSQVRLSSSPTSSPRLPVTSVKTDDEQWSSTEQSLRCQPESSDSFYESGNAWSAEGRTDFVQHESEKVEQVSGDVLDPKDGATLEERNQMREVERRWVMSTGREKVTPAATAISIPPPAIPTDAGDSITVLAPLQHVPATPVSQDDDPPKGAPCPPLPTNPRNVQFARVRGAAKWAEAQRTLHHQNHVNTTGHPPAKLNTTTVVPSPKTVESRHPSESGTPSSKPNSASSKRSTPVSVTTTATANLLNRRRGHLRHRYGMKVESKTSDPRYTSLEHSLIPVPHPPVHPDVTSIVQSFDALHVQPKLRKEVKPDTSLKALSYINERGFVF